MKIEKIKVSDLKPYENNAKIHTHEQVEQIKKSIQEFGFNDPIAVDENNMIVEGHGRLMAVKALGYTEVDCIRLVGMTDEQKRAYIHVHNQLTLNTGFDLGILEAELKSLECIDMEFYGFDMDFDIDTDFDGESTEDDYEPETPEEPKTKLGDIYQLGRHRLMCGDSTSLEDAKKLMNGNKADICFTSPPYNAGSLNIDGQDGTKEKYNSYDDNKSEQEYFEFIRTNMGIMLSVANEVFYNIGLVENNKRQIIRLQNEFINQFKDIIYWKKSTVAPHIQPGVINNLVEFILCFGNGKRKFENAQFSQGTYWNVIEGSNASGNEYSSIHKATFPVYLPANIVANFTPNNGSVIDCFGGTGTTLIACEQLNRTCYMMELDPKYVDVIIARWEKYTGEKAVLLNGNR